MSDCPICPDKVKKRHTRITECGHCFCFHAMYFRKIKVPTRPCCRGVVAENLRSIHKNIVFVEIK